MRGAACTTLDSWCRRLASAFTFGSWCRRLACIYHSHPDLTVAAGHAVGRVLAVYPRAGQLLVVGWDDHAAGVAGLPTHDLVRLAALLAALLPFARPAVVGENGFALLLVPEERMAVAIAL